MAPTVARRRWIGGATLAAAAIVALVWLLQIDRGATQVDVLVPEFSPTARAGQAAFEASCATCHGPAAGGTDQGPPLVHRIYEPNHHADAAFVLAARRGVPQHHWDFGSMPPQPQVGERSLQQIIAYVRELQRANGIE
ncbi:MAG TPA: cytochrome c [Geminicoccaceae bacterium]|nr:cytochrome c [Geminicoccaceae bacterium]